MANQLYATGRRKDSIARVYITEGTGNYIVNGKPLKEYFSTVLTREEALKAIKVLELNGKLDAKIFVKGGGISGQSGATKLAVARILAGMSDENKKKLREFGLLTRDPRAVERKHFGKKKARRGQQSSKR